MSNINNRGLEGQPVLPFPQVRVYAGDDVFVPMTFLDWTKAPQTPTLLTYQLDDITNAINMIPSTTVTTGLGSSYTLQLPGSSMNMDMQWQGSQLCQLSVTAVIPITGGGTQTIRGVFIIELCAIQTPLGT